MESGDWRSKCKSAAERWCEAWKRKLYTDVEFIVGEGDLAKSFSAHRNVLAFNSPVFEAMFFGALPEKKKVIPLPDIEPEAIELFLRYIYGEEPKFSSVASAARTFLMADQYLVPDLQQLAESYITKTSLDDAQFWETIHVDRLFSVPLVHKKCSEYLNKNAATLFKSHLLSNISSRAMESILLMDKIQVSEYELLLAMIRWASGNCTKRAKALLVHIRFSNLTIDEFCKFQDDHPSFIDDKDSLLIMKHIYKPASYALPKWCSVSDKKRT